MNRITIAENAREREAWSRRAKPTTTAEVGLNYPAVPDRTFALYLEGGLTVTVDVGHNDRVAARFVPIDRMGETPFGGAVLGARNRDFIDRILAPGDTYRVPNMSELRLTAGDAGAIELILDGIPVGFAGKRGVRARGFPLTPQSLVRLRLTSAD